MKRLLAIILCLTMCLSMVPAAAADGGAKEVGSNEIIASGSCGASVNWTLSSDGVLTIYGTGAMDGSGDPPWKDYQTNITSIVIKSGVTVIRGLYNCSRLKSVTIPASVIELRGTTFYGCSSLTTITLLNGITAIPDGCFYNCTALKSVNIPSGVTSIGRNAFYYCSSLSSLTLPAGLQAINEYAFYGSALTKITIPAAVTEIGNGAFACCNALTTISVSTDNQAFSSSNGVLFNKNKSVLVAFPAGKSGSYTIPNSVYAIKPFAFSGCKKLGQVTVGSNVAVIPTYCFYEASVTGITLPSSLEAFEQYALFSCSGLSSITIPAKVDTIGDGAFSNCSNLQTINFLGDAPNFTDNALIGTGSWDEHVKAFYPANAGGWSTATQSAYGSSYLDWLPYKKPSISTQPKAQTVFPGQTAYFTVAANTNVTYQWYYRTDKDGEWKTCRNGSDATLSVEGKTYRDGYQYRCKMTNPSGAVTSSYATLYISKPVITTQPKSETIESNSRAEFMVYADGATGYQWYFRTSLDGEWCKCSNSGVTSISTHEFSFLEVVGKTYRNGYQYRCAVKNEMGTVYTKTVTLTVMDPPVITTQPQDETVSVGASANFTVKATGSSLSYQWQFRSSSDASWSNCSGGTSATLTVEAKSYRDGYQYRCKVSNALGTVYSNTVTLRIKPAVTTQPKSATVSAGEIATFTVKADCAESYQWQFRKSADAGWSSCSDGTGASFSVEAKTYRNGYQYRCKVSNSVGTTYSEAATLRVLPRIDGQPADQTAAAGETVFFSVSAVGADSFQWYFRSSETGAWSKCSGDGATGATLSVEAKSYRSGYQYRCRLTNSAGSVYSAAATLTVN